MNAHCYQYFVQDLAVASKLTVNPAFFYTAGYDSPTTIT